MPGQEDKYFIHVHRENKEIMLLLYIDRRNLAKKNINVFFMMYQKITKDRKKREPQYIYNKSKLPTIQWSINVFLFLLITIQTNNKTILEDN